MRPRRVSLVLGAGGARGYAHIGAIAELTERGYEIVAVAGSSMGALVGGLYAAGKLDEFAEWALGLSRRDVLRLVDVSVAGPGLARAERVMSTIRELVGDARIEDLAVPFTAVGTDLFDHREVWFQRGRWTSRSGPRSHCRGSSRRWCSMDGCSLTAD